MWNIGPGSVHEFPPWVVSAYQIAVRHGYTGTEREFRLSLLGADGVDNLPMLLVTDEDEETISEDYEAIMRPSSSEYAYYTEKNEFRSADEDILVPDGLRLMGRVLTLTCEGDAMGTPTELPTTDLPAVTTADNGKVMKVVAGAWTAAAI